jgi:glutathione synthase/RimK-type ligase-like ATP-grasp enzyme
MFEPIRPIGIFYEHPQWFLPLFAKLEQRNTPFRAIDATSHQFDPTDPAERDLALVVNRMSPSAFRRGHAHAIFYTQHYLGHLEAHGIRVINGSKAFRYETSKALQLSLLNQLGLPAPRARVINHASQAVAAGARDCGFQSW